MLFIYSAQFIILNKLRYFYLKYNRSPTNQQISTSTRQILGTSPPLPLNLSSKVLSMRNFKYQTIDPLILQTLNLNEKRMDHILGILHGCPQKQQGKTKRDNHLLEEFPRLKNTLHISLLPNISKRDQSLQNQAIKDYANYATLDATKSRRAWSLNKSAALSKLTLRNYQQQTSTKRDDKRQGIRRVSMQKPENSQIQLITVQPNHLPRTQRHNNEQQIHNTRRSFSTVRKEAQIISSPSNLVTQSKVANRYRMNKHQEYSVVQQGVLLHSPSFKHSFNTDKHLSKQKQLIKDYMREFQVKKSKSMQAINSKDIYRFEIQSIVSELTPVEKLLEAEKRMEMLKKKHQHLRHFDQKYYSKLNQNDLIAL